MYTRSALLATFSLLVALPCAQLRVQADVGGDAFIAVDRLSSEVAGDDPRSRSDFESRAFFAALANLEFYMQAGVENNVGRAAPLLSSFVINKQRARDDTRRLFRQNLELLEGYVSVSNDVYGYEFIVDRFGPSVQFEGGVQTEAGMIAEFEATMVFRDEKWLIWSLEID